MSESNSSCQSGAVLQVTSLSQQVNQLKEEIETACGSPNAVTASMLRQWADEVGEGGKAGSDISRQIALQTVLSDYLINERLSGTITKAEFSRACDQIKRRGGMDKLYAGLLSLTSGSGHAFSQITASRAESWERY